MYIHVHTCSAVFINIVKGGKERFDNVEGGGHTCIYNTKMSKSQGGAR